MVLTWGSFWIPASAYPARIALILTNCLASCVILRGLGSELPKTEYTTALEIYIIVNLTLIICTMFEYLFVLHTARKKMSTDGKSLLRAETGKEKAVGKMIGGSIFVYRSDLYGGVKGTVEVVNPTKKRGYLPQIFNSDDPLADRISRLLLPIIFVVFNLVYVCVFIL